MWSDILDVVDGVLGVGGGLVLRRIADKTLRLGEGHVRGGDTVSWKQPTLAPGQRSGAPRSFQLTLVVDENLNLALLHHTDAAVGGTKILRRVSSALASCVKWGCPTIPMTVPMSSVDSACAVWTKARGDTRSRKKARRPKARPDRCPAMVGGLSRGTRLCRIQSNGQCIKGKEKRRMGNLLVEQVFLASLIRLSFRDGRWDGEMEKGGKEVKWSRMTLSRAGEKVEVSSCFPQKRPDFSCSSRHWAPAGARRGGQ